MSGSSSRSGAEGTSGATMPVEPSLSELREVFGELADQPRWVAWKEVVRDDPDDPAKVPVDPATGDFGSVSNRDTWGGLEAAYRRYEEDGLNGVGIVLGGGLGGIDLDACRDPETGELTPWADRILSRFDRCYAEVSPSGTGVKILTLGAPDELPASLIPMDASPPRDGNQPQIEAYVSGRYFAVTGEALEDAGTIRDASGAWDQMVRELRDQGVAASGADDGGRDPDWFTKALEGVPEGQRDVTATRIAGRLAHDMTVPEPAALEFLRWWNRERCPKPLSDSQIEKCVRSVYRTERRKRDAEGGVTEIRLMGHQEYGATYSAEKRSDWLVPRWIRRLGFGTVVGPPEAYKSWLLYDLAFSVASGLPFLGQFEIEDPGPVVIFQLEDTNESVMRRLNLIEQFRRGYRVPPEADHADLFTGPLPLDIPLFHFPDFGLDLEPRTIDLMCERILEVDAQLVIFDPLFTLGDEDDEYLRRMANQIQPLKQRQEELGCAIQFGHHSKKNDEAENSTRRSRTYGSQFLDASKNFDWQVRKTGDSAIALKRYFKHDATEDEVGIAFDINTDPEQGPWRYEVAVEDKRGRGPYGEPPIHEPGMRTPHAIRLAIYECVAANPGQTWREIREALSIRKGQSIRGHREWLDRHGHIENRGSDAQHAWHPTDDPYLPEMEPDDVP